MALYSPIYTTADLVYAKTGLSATEVDLTDESIMSATVEDAEKELEMLIGRKFTDANSFTEYLNIKYDEDIVGNQKTTVQLTHWPIQSISVLQRLDTDGDAEDTYDTLTSAEITAGTYASDDYWLDLSNDSATNALVPNGKIIMKTDAFAKGTHKVKCTYTYGYSSVPVVVRDLATCLAGIRCWIRFLGGCYNRLNSYSIPQQSVNKGDFYARGKQNIDMLKEEADRLLDRIGKKSRTFFGATGGVT